VVSQFALYHRLLSFRLGHFGRRTRNLVRGRASGRGRLQLGVGVLRDVGEIGRQSWRSRRRFGLGPMVGWFGRGFIPR
jgi:hypothetical protein